MPLLKKKLCIVGAFAVGKTSLVHRFVRNFFSDQYLSTIGVRVDKRTMRVGGREIDLILWDVAGGINESRGEPGYLRGLSGSVIVADGTRAATVEVVSDLTRFVEDHEGRR